MPRASSSAELDASLQAHTSARSKKSSKASGQAASPQTKGKLLLPEEQPITAQLAAAGSRRNEFETLLQAAPPDATPAQLRALVVEENTTGKASAASRAKVWRQLKENYLLDPDVPEYRAFMAALQDTKTPSDRGLLLFLMLARMDRLFREVTLANVSPLLGQGGIPINTDAVQVALERMVGTERRWTQETLVTARQHILSALKDFDVLQGGIRKKIVRPHPGEQVTLFAARLAQLEGLAPRQILASKWFRLLGCDSEGAWELLYAAARAGVLRCRRQADVIELELPPLPPQPARAV
jgi:hypothetical protein